MDKKGTKRLPNVEHFNEKEVSKEKKLLELSKIKKTLSFEF